MSRLLSRVLSLALVLAFTGLATAQDLASFEKRVTVRKLPNGLTVVLMRRAEAPVFSFATYVNVGSSQDPQGESGLAHMFEHMAFKGTPTIGTKNWPEEQKLLKDLESAYQEYDREKRKPMPDEKKVAELEKKWKAIADEADKLVKTNEYGEIVESHGGVGMNAFTSMDETVYFYSMPANESELWAYLESSRLLHPVFREFYKERNVVVEERRMRTESSPIGRLVEQLQAAAYVAHPYQRSGVGWPSEITNVTATEAEAFYKKYYVPSNIVLAVVGDIEPNTLMPIIEKYFGRLPAEPAPEGMVTVEPKQNSEREVILHEQSQPWYIEAYHRPDYRDKDDAVYDAIQDLMANGRTSRLYRSLVRDQKVALFAGGFSGFPGNKYPNLFVFYAVPTQRHTPQELADGIHKEIDRIKTQDISDAELEMIKTRAKADLIRGLADNEGLALQLATYQTRYGDWRELFRSVDRIEKVTKADIRRIANAVFVEDNRTVAMIENVKPAVAAQKGGK